MSDWFDEVLIENPFDEDPSASDKDKETSVDDLPTKKRQRRPKPRRGTKREDNIYYSSDSHATTAEEGTTRDRLSYRELKEVQRGAKILSKVFLETLNDWIGYRDQAFPPEVAAVLLDTFADEVALGGYLPKETEGIYYSGDRFVFPEEVREDMDKHFATTYEYGKELGDINSDQIDEYKVLDTNKDRGRRGEMFGFRDDVFKIKKHEPDYRLEPIDNREERLRELSRKSRQRQIDKSLSQLDEQVPPEYLNYQYDRLVANPEIPRSTRADIEEFISETLVKRDAIKNLKYQFLTVYGSKFGTGKTTLAVAVAREIVRRTGSSATFIQATDFMSRASFDYEELVRELDASRVLIIDDLGVTVQDMTQRQRDTLSKVIDSRWSDPDKVTIITTNLPPVGTSVKMGLSDYFGKASWSRFSDNMLMVELNKGSYRGSGRVRNKDKE